MMDVHRSAFRAGWPSASRAGEHWTARSRGATVARAGEELGAETHVRTLR